MNDGNMNYLSLFSGIGSFELAIHKQFPNANCLGFSEIDEVALKIYKVHFPTHRNLGDITKFTKSMIRKAFKNRRCDLIVGGFPCTNLSCLANLNGDNSGLNGPQSKLFYNMVKVIKYVRKLNPKVKFIIENNYSMRKSDRLTITCALEKRFSPTYSYMIDNASFGLQTRKRIIWTNFPFEPPCDNEKCQQTWIDVLQSIKSKEVQKSILSDNMVSCMNKLYECKNSKGYTKQAERSEIKGGTLRVYKFVIKITEKAKSRWDIHPKSDTAQVKCKPITGTYGGGNNSLIDRRVAPLRGSGVEFNCFVFRSFTVTEIERLFGLPDGYTNQENICNTDRVKVLGNSIPIFLCSYVIKFFK